MAIITNPASGLAEEANHFASLLEGELIKDLPLDINKKKLLAAIESSVSQLADEVPYKDLLRSMVPQIVDRCWERIVLKAVGVTEGLTSELDMNNSIGLDEALKSAKQNGTNETYFKMLLSSVQANEFQRILEEWHEWRAAETLNGEEQVQSTAQFVQELAMCCVDVPTVEMVSTQLDVVAADIARAAPYLDNDGVVTHTARLRETVSHFVSKIRFSLASLEPIESWSASRLQEYGQSAANFICQYVILLAANPATDDQSAAGITRNVTQWLFGQSSSCILNGTMPLLASTLEDLSQAKSRAASSGLDNSQQCRLSAANEAGRSAVVGLCSLRTADWSNPEAQAKLVCAARLADFLAIQSKQSPWAGSKVQHLLAQTSPARSLVNYLPIAAQKVNFRHNDPQFSSAVRQYILKSATLDEILDMCKTLLRQAATEEHVADDQMSFFIDKSADPLAEMND